MVSFSPRPLAELCGIRIAYMMYTRYDVIKKSLSITGWRSICSIERWNDVENDVEEDVKNLPLLDQWKSLILVPLIPIGRHLVIFLNVWLSKTHQDKSVSWLTRDMLYKNLVLNGDGLINQRKTAEKILSSRMLPNVDAFRLACITFLEVEVLKLWPHVMHYFLNKLVRDSEEPFVVNDTTMPFQTEHELENVDLNPTLDSDSVIKEDWTSYLSEPHEVLFWITHCLSKEQGTDIHAVPHFLNHKNWHNFSIESAYSSGNFSVLDYYNQYCNRNDFLDFKKMIFTDASYAKDVFHSFFAFHISQIPLSEIKDLFEESPKLMVFRFLQWPLSLMFLENTEEIWNLIPDIKKSWVFSQLITILYLTHWVVECMLIHFTNRWREPLFYSRLHCMDHIRSIFLKLWKISSDSHKVDFLNFYVFQSILGCHYGQERENFVWQFENKGLKQKLLNLFLANETSVLELYEGTCVPSSLKSLVAKYMPEHLDELETGLLPFLTSIGFTFGMEHPIRVLRGFHHDMHKKYAEEEGVGMPEPKLTKYWIEEDFINYIKVFVLLSNNIDNSFFYD